MFKARNNLPDRDPDSTVYAYTGNCVLPAHLSLQVDVVKVAMACVHRASPDDKDEGEEELLTFPCCSVSLSGGPRETKLTGPGGRVGGSRAPSWLC